MAEGVHCHLGKLLELLGSQTPKLKVQRTVGNSWLGPRASSALQQLTATARQTQRKVVKWFHTPPQSHVGLCEDF